MKETQKNTGIRRVPSTHPPTIRRARGLQSARILTSRARSTHGVLAFFEAAIYCDSVCRTRKGKTSKATNTSGKDQETKKAGIQVTEFATSVPFFMVIAGMHTTGIWS